MKIIIQWIVLCTFLTVLSFIFAEENPGLPKVIVVGIAQDGGIPHLGCNQTICKTQHHFVSSLVVRDGSHLYLFDATPDIREQSRELASRLPDLAVSKNIYDGIFLTHAHIGHYTGLMFFGKESIAASKMPVYCSRQMSDFLRGNAPWNLLVTNENIELHAVEPGTVVSLGTLKVTPISVPHRKEFTDTYGYIISGQSRSLLFIPDIDSWEPVKDRMNEWLQICDYALVDGTFYSGDELPGRDITKVPHPTVLNSIEFFQKFPSKKASICFIHLNHTNPLLDPNSEAAKSVKRAGFRVASEWAEFPL